MLLEVFGGLMAVLGFLMFNLLAGVGISSSGLDLPTLVNNALSAVGS